MLQWLKNLREKRSLHKHRSQYHLVGKEQLTVIWTDVGNKETYHNIYLYENGYGKRKFTVKTTGFKTDVKFERHSKSFLIYDWEKGFNNHYSSRPPNTDSKPNLRIVK